MSWGREAAEARAGSKETSGQSLELTTSRLLTWLPGLKAKRGPGTPPGKNRTRVGAGAAFLLRDIIPDAFAPARASCRLETRVLEAHTGLQATHDLSSAAQGQPVQASSHLLAPSTTTLFPDRDLITSGT